MFDIIIVQPNFLTDTSQPNIVQRFPFAKHAHSVIEAQQQSLTEFFWVVPSDVIVNNTFDFDYVPDSWSQDYIHVFKNGTELYDGIALIPKTAVLTADNIQIRFSHNTKNVDVIASTPCPYDIFNIDTFAEYTHALENSTTEMFWMSTTSVDIDLSVVNNFYIPYTDIHSRNRSHAFLHCIADKQNYNGIFLCSKNTVLSKREVEYRFPANRIEHNIVASKPMPYDIFYIDTYAEYMQALKNSKTEMFFVVPTDVIVSDEFKFDIHFTFDNVYDRSINHVYLNDTEYTGIVLCSKASKITKTEFLSKDIANKKQVAIVASVPMPYDIVFISYKEPDADKNYQNLLKIAPRAFRVHGITGIHNAHIAAAKLCKSKMFWVVDADATIINNFTFDLQVHDSNLTSVHVWRSQNPVNELVYGYGGVKLLPRVLTENMDTSKTDMTTSISDQFKLMPEISNITSFNTDPYSTWKSAFRECVKLSSKLIDRQNNIETQKRLHAWCTVGDDKLYGKHAIAGAIAGALYGKANKGNYAALKKINDFDWLKEQYDNRGYK
jgi:hypothetical protein